jgi:hypothetical protein
VLYKLGLRLRGPSQVARRSVIAVDTNPRGVGTRVGLQSAALFQEVGKIHIYETCVVPVIYLLRNKLFCKRGCTDFLDF